jgi:hypothetical protein
MKIRMGFVSNSSSSSFCIIGIADKDVDALEINSVYDFEDDLDGFTECYEYNHCIGLSITKIDENETFKAFKERAARTMTEVLKKEIKPSDLEIIIDQYQC